MVDDLVLQGVTEPYRMLTARPNFACGCAPTMRGPTYAEGDCGWLRFIAASQSF
jgi:hypothetical protein